MVTGFQRIYPPSRPMPGPAFWLLFRGNDVLVQEQEADLSLLLLDDAAITPLEPDSTLFLGTLNGTPCMAGEISLERELPADWRAVGIRTLFDHLDKDAYSVVGYAS